MSAKVDGGDATLVRPSNWNDSEVVSGTPDGGLMGVDASQADGWQVIPFTGLMMPAAYAVVAGSEPVGWLLCDGRPVSRTTFARLFAVVGSTWGAGDGSTTFNLPDMRFKAPVGAGSSATLTPTGTTSSGQPTLTSMSSTAGIAVGDIVTGTNIPTITVTGNTSSGLSIIYLVSSFAGITVGSLVSGTGIPANTFVTSLDPTGGALGNIIGISQAATASNGGVTFTISNTTVTLVQNATTVTISANASGSGSGIVLTFTKPLNTTRTVGQVGGEEKHGLISAEIPLLQHNHTDPGHSHTTPGHVHAVLATGGGGTTSNTLGIVLSDAPSFTTAFTQADGGGVTNTVVAGLALANLGGTAVHNNLPPFGVCSWVIKT